MATTTTSSSNGTKSKAAKPPPVLTGPTTTAKPQAVQTPDAKPAKGPKQLPIPGTERKTPPAIEKAVLAYREARDLRMEQSKVEQLAYAKLVAVLEDNGVDLTDGKHYEFKDEDGRAVKVIAEVEPETVKVRVRTVKSKDDDGEED